MPDDNATLIAPPWGLTMDALTTFLELPLDAAPRWTVTITRGAERRVLCNKPMRGSFLVENPGALDRRLVDCFWRLVGIVVPRSAAGQGPIFEHPNDDPEAPVLQIYGFWVWQAGSSAYGEFLWHPQRGHRFAVSVPSLGDGSQEMNQAALWLKASMRLLSEVGRQRGSGRFRDAADFRRTVVGDLQRLRRNHRPDTQQELASLWYEEDEGPVANVDSLIAEIKRYCSPKSFDIPWSRLQSEARRQ